MNIVDTFRQHFGTLSNISNDFSLVECDDGIMIGVDKSSHLSVVLKSKSPKRFPIMHKTQNMSIECNMRVTYLLDGITCKDAVHILRCLSDNPREKELFLELATVLISEGDGSEESIMDTFNLLRTFFNNKKDILDNELIGLYAELYTICAFHKSLEIEQYWQSRDRMKFDFSITEKLKLEVKATTKNSRTHHFRHEQLMTELYDIYVLSYMLRYDDEGLSLFDLIKESKEYLKTDSRKLMKIDNILRNVSEERLKNLRFNRDYTDANMHIYSASNIPKFNQVTPSGVANAEYDCVLDNIGFISFDDFEKIVQKTKEEIADV